MPDRVLLVAADAELLRAVDAWLGRLGCEVSHAGTAAAGLDAFARSRPDVVILDPRLPDDHGLEVLERLRAQGASIIVLTGPGDADAGRAGRLALELARETAPWRARHVALTLADVERRQIERALRFHNRNRTRAAQELGISRATLINKIKAYGLDL